MIGEIVLQPEGETLAVEVRGDLPSILSAAAGRKIAPEFPKPGKKSEGVRGDEIISQVEMVAGARRGQIHQHKKQGLALIREAAAFEYGMCA